jgi:hypothetical protein
MRRSLFWLATLALIVISTAHATVPAVAQVVRVATPSDCDVEGSEGHIAPHAFEFADLERLWEVVDLLESGADPSPERWNELISGPGYSRLVQEEIPAGVLFESLRVAFLPSLQAKKSQWEDQDSPALQLVEHFIELDAKRPMIRDLLTGLSKEKDALSRRSMTLACAYFKCSMLNREKPFTVAFAAFQKDARGYGDTIIMDPVFALEAGPNLALWLAHETHHLLRNPVARAPSPMAQDGAERSVAWVLLQLESEGIADQIDKPHTFFGDGYMAMSKFAEYFRAELTSAPKRIGQLDVLMRELADCTGKCDDVGDRIRDTAKMAGHPLGYYMAGVIERSLGRAALIESIGDPTRFITAYNRAANLDAQRPPVFSDRSLAYAARLFAKPCRLLEEARHNSCPVDGSTMY